MAFHINPKTGEPGPCKAMVSCPFGDLEADHYATADDARQAYEEKMGMAAPTGTEGLASMRRRLSTLKSEIGTARDAKRRATQAAKDAFMAGKMEEAVELREEAEAYGRKLEKLSASEKTLVKAIGDREAKNKPAPKPTPAPANDGSSWTPRHYGGCGGYSGC